MTTHHDNRRDENIGERIDDLLTLHEVAALLRIPDATLRYWRHCNTGPHSYKIGRHVRYQRRDVEIWLCRQRTSGGSDPA